MAKAAAGHATRAMSRDIYPRDRKKARRFSAPMNRTQKPEAAGVESDAPVRPTEFTTAGLPLPTQFSAFRGAYRGVFDMHLERVSAGGFPVRQDVWNLGRVILVSAHLPGPQHVFGLCHSRSTTLDHWYALVKCGDASPEAPAEPIHLSFHCLADPFQTEIGASRLLVAFIPRDIFPFGFDFEAIRDRPLDSGAGLLLMDFLVILNRRLPRLRLSELAGLPSAVRGLLALHGTSPPAHQGAARNAIDVRLLERAKRLIDRKIEAPDLSPGSLAEELFVSRSRLYRAFEAFGGVSVYIRRQRLLRTREALADASDTRSILRIAEQWGFADASVFSRAFRSEFGVSPSAVRRAGWMGGDHQRERNAIVERSQEASLEQLLRQLRS
ncbi:helix-turn-helix domain-containing protein [Chelatococcus sp. HY11]|uniref:helix-turn-helix domain-containing protein n=1 Tax=Chelatococcus sp. HY11 TaxID=2835634 RepID=UPI001BD0C29C|nr:helix-turn-helix domain-containing protein [Chelatococcus sp. HY11]MBS7742217.1 helix-turn-helix domain-containing protein [Chelatococcus sp. HY11]MCO5075119.1 helix-turn-helix domain-containing protein [Chelatococcus sp.]